jgi:transposase
MLGNKPSLSTVYNIINQWQTDGTTSLQGKRGSMKSPACF